MADDIGGLQVDFTAEASQLRAELQRMEQQLRAFDRAHGRHQVQLTARINQPGQRAIADARRGIQRALEADSGLLIRPRLAMPQTKELATFSASLGKNVPAVTVKVKGVWDGWSTPPPSSLTVNVRGGGGGTGGTATAAAGPRQATVRAPMATQVTGPAKPSREEIQRAREENRRAARTGATAVAAPAPRPQTRVQAAVRKAAGNEARAAAQTQTASRSEVFRDWDDQTLLAEYLSTQKKGGSVKWLASAREELVSRGFDPSQGAPGAGPSGFASPALTAGGALVGGTSAARGRGSTAPRTHAQIPRTVRPASGQKVSELILQGAMQSGTPPAEATSMSRLRSIIPQLTAGNRSRGESWYPEANRELKRLRKAYGLGNRINDAQLSGIAGVFSANADWPTNLRLVSGFFKRMSEGVSPSNAEGFLGIGTFVDPIVKAAQIAAMDNPTMAQIAARKDVQTGPQWLKNKPGKKSFFGLKTGAFTGALHAGAGPRQEQEARSAFSALTPMDRWMSRGIHGIENVGAKAHQQGWRAMQALRQKAGFKTDFGFQAGLWDFFGPEQAAAAPYGKRGTVPPLPAESEPASSAILKNLERRRAALGATPQAGQPQIAAFMNPTPAGLMQSPSSQLDEFGMPTAGAQQRYGMMQARERTPSEAQVLAGKQAWNRQQAAQQRVFGRYGGSGPGAGIAAFDNPLPQGGATPPNASPVAQAALDLKSLSSAARDMVSQLKNHPEMEAAFRKSVPDLFAEIDAAQKQANLAAAAKAEGGKPLRTAEEIALQRIHRITGGEGSDAERQQAFLEASRTGVREARGVQQTLSLGRTLGSMTAGALGGTRDKGRIDQLVRLQSEYARVGRAGSDAFEKVELAQTALDKATIQQAPAEDIERLTKAYDEANDEAQLFRNEQARIGTEMEKVQAKISKPIAALRGSFSALTGALVGGFVYSAAIDGITALASALEKPVDAIGGYVGAASRLEASLGQTTRSMHGHAEFAVAAATAQAGLGDETFRAIAPLVTERAAVQAGNEAFGEQLDIIRSASLFRAQQRAAQRGEAFGLGITPGALPGISGATGGLFGSAFGGQMPLIEQLAGLTPQGTRGQRAGFAAAGGLGGALAGAGTGAALGLAGGPFAPITVAGGAAIGGLLGLLGGAGLGGALGPELAGFSDIDLSGGRPAAGTPLPTGRSAGRLAGFAAAANAAGARAGRAPELTEKEVDHIENLKLAVSDLSESAVRATPSLQGVMAAIDSGDAEAIKATAEAMKGWVPEDQIEALRRSGFSVTGQGGQALGRRELQQYFQSAVRGASMPSREQAAQAATMPLAASLQLSQWQGRMQRDTLIPGQQYLGQLASGRVGVGGARQGGFGIRDLPPEIAQSAPNYQAGTEALTSLQQQMESTAQSGRSSLITMLQQADKALTKATGSTSNLTGEFKGLEASISFNATAMRGLQIDNMWAQANLQVAQYDEQLRVANRSLADAQSFISGIGAGELGILQHRARGLEISAAEVGFRQQELGLTSQQLGLQSSSLSIRARELQLAQSQRQINFQTALAGFTAPGMTGAERAARQDEAAAEAKFAQQQHDIAAEALDIDRQQIGLQAQNIALAEQALGISREAFEVQQMIVSVNAARAVEDLNHQIALLTQARSVTLQVAINNEAIAAYQEQISADMERISGVIQDAYNVQQQVMQNAASLAATYGGRLTEWNNIILNNLNKYLIGATNLLSNYSSSAGSWSSGTGGSNTSTNYTGPTATGFMGTVNAATQFMVGEAGTETVAILRNPRNLITSLEGGGTSSAPPIVVQVDVHDNQISGGEADEFAAMIARKVEEALGRRINQYGLGTRR